MHPTESCVSFLGRIREKLTWEFLHAFSVHSALRTFPDCFCRQGRIQETFRDEFLMRHADVAVEIPVRVSWTSGLGSGRRYLSRECVCVFVMVKLNAIPGQAFGTQKVELPEFLDSRYMNIVRLSALRTGRLYTPRDNPGAHFC